MSDDLAGRGERFAGRCGRGACTTGDPAVCYSTSTRWFYCPRCAALINRCPGNVRPDGSPLCQPVFSEEEAHRAP